ncbi:MAG: PDZ domain-containing protein [Robiginitomaculum sp.]
MQFNKDWFVSVEKKPLPKPPPFSQTLQIDKVASGSPAESLRLRAGDKFLAINGAPALTANVAEIVAAGKPVKYRFFLPREKSFLEVEAKAGLPLGLLAAPSSDGIVAHYTKVAAFDTEGFMTLWEREDYPQIRAACKIANKRVNVRSLGKLIGRPKSMPFADFMLGICDIEIGDREAGYAAIYKFGGSKAYGYTGDITAVIDYYRALEMKRQGDSLTYQDNMHSAYAAYPQSARITREALRAGVEINAPDGRIGTKLADYNLTYLEGGNGATTLHAIISDIPKAKIMPLCLMAGYRGNGPYNEALLPYIAVYPYAKDRLHPMTVMTNIADKRTDRPHWNSHEDLARENKCPLTVALEPEEQFAEDLNLRGAPEFVMINSDGIIIWSGDLHSDYAYWEMLFALPV